MKPQPVHFASLLAIGLLSLLVLATWIPEKKFDPGEGRHWPVSLEITADISELVVPNVVVQDTLNWYASRLNDAIPGLRSRMQFHSCCEGTTDARAELRLKLDLEFPLVNQRDAVIQQIVTERLVQQLDLTTQQDWTMGLADLTLLIPGTEEVLQLNQVAFGLQFHGSHRNYMVKS